MSEFHEFAERLQFSEGIGLTADILRHVIEHIPAASGVRKAALHEDRHGTDYWIDRRHGLPPVSIDLKNREFCPIEKFGTDDVCIETCSVYRGTSRPFTHNLRDKPGWTIDERKRTDLIVYTWPHSADLFGAPRLRYWILYFPFLCAASMRMWESWAKTYTERPARNNGYLTLSVYVPRNVIATTIREFTSGVFAEAPF